MLMPVLPQMGEQLGLSGSAAGLAVTAFSLTAGLGILFAGYLLLGALALVAWGGVTDRLGSNQGRDPVKIENVSASACE